MWYGQGGLLNARGRYLFLLASRTCCLDMKAMYRVIVRKKRDLRNNAQGITAHFRMNGARSAKYLYCMLLSASITGILGADIFYNSRDAL
jgi:hypothetical protein